MFVESPVLEAVETRHPPPETAPGCNVLQEVAEFIARQVLERDAQFFDG